jgi:cation:H+ antiporter
VLAGIYLVKYADIIAVKLNLSKAFVGGLLLAGATSLPELIVDLNSVSNGAVDLAVGDLLGSSLFNLLILAVADLLHKSKKSLFSKTSSVHALSGSISIGLTAIAGISIGLSKNIESFKIGSVGLSSILIFIFYLLGLRMVYTDQKKILLNNINIKLETELNSNLSLRKAIFGYFMSVMIIFIAAPFLSASATDIAQISGLSGTFIGTTLVALSTSLPELVSTLAAVKIGAFDLAIGNIYGSNAFNMILFLPLDLALGEPILSIVSGGHIITAFAIIICTSLSIMGQLYQIEERKRFIEPDAFTIIATILCSLYLLYKFPILIS